MTIELSTSGLRSKWGFMDGDVLDDLLWGHSYEGIEDGDRHLSFEHEVLARCVEKFLKPRLPETAEMYRIGTIHNPIRFTNENVDAPEITVAIEDAEILAIAESVKKEWGKE